MSDKEKHGFASEHSFLQDFFCFQNILETAFHWWKLILGCAVAGLIVAALLSWFFIKPVYMAKSSMFAWRFEEDADKGYRGASTNAYRDLTAALMLVNDYRELLNSQRVSSRLKANVESAFPERSAARLAYNVKINNSNESRVLFIEAQAADPEVACFVANETANILAETIGEVMMMNSVQIIDTAKTATSMGNRSLIRNLPIGTVSGFIIGALVAMIIAFFDQTIKNPEQVIRYIDGAIMGTVPLMEESVLEGNSLQALLSAQNQQELAESFRLLRANLPYLAVSGRDDSKCRVFMSSSTVPHEGKSNCISALAVITARAGKKVLLMDCDLRKPTIHRIFKVNNDRGVVSVLSGEAGFADVVKHLDDSIDLITCGPIPPNPSELLMSGNFEKMLKELRSQYDYIFIDTTPMLFLTDPLIITPHVDGVLFLLACKQAKIGLIRRAMQSLKNIAPDMPLGVVVNRFNRRDAIDYYHYNYRSYYNSSYYYYYHSDGEGGRKEAKKRKRRRSSRKESSSGKKEA